MEILIKDIPINYEEYGKGKPVLCIHGYMVDHRMMKNCFEPVFVRDWVKRVEMEEEIT